MQNFNLNEQYEKEAASKYGDTHYYQAYKDKQNVRMNQNSKIILRKLISN